MNIEQLNDSIQERLDTRGSHNTSPPDSSSSEQESNEVSSETQELLEISCEFDYHEYLLEKLRDHGWNVHRHVQPDNSNYEVDLLINHPKYDSEWIGIEAKFIDSDPAGITLGVRTHPDYRKTTGTRSTSEILLIYGPSHRSTTYRLTTWNMRPTQLA